MLRTDWNLREYARLEYGTNHAEWLIAEARRARAKALRPKLWAGLFRPRASTTRRALPHKGSPGANLLEARTQA